MLIEDCLSCISFLHCNKDEIKESKYCRRCEDSVIWIGGYSVEGLFINIGSDMLRDSSDFLFILIFGHERKCLPLSRSSLKDHYWRF